MMIWKKILKPTPYDILNIGQIGLTLHTNRSHKFILIVDFSGWTLGGIPGVLFLLHSYYTDVMFRFSGDFEYI